MKNTPKNQTLNDPIIFKEQKEVILRMIKIEERINLNALTYDTNIQDKTKIKKIQQNKRLLRKYIH